MGCMRSRQLYLVCGLFGLCGIRSAAATDLAPRHPAPARRGLVAGDMPPAAAQALSGHASSWSAGAAESGCPTPLATPLVPGPQPILSVPGSRATGTPAWYSAEDAYRHLRRRVAAAGDFLATGTARLNRLRIDFSILQAELRNAAAARAASEAQFEQAQEYEKLHGGPARRHRLERADARAQDLARQAMQGEQQSQTIASDRERDDARALAVLQSIRTAQGAARFHLEQGDLPSARRQLEQLDREQENFRTVVAKLVAHQKRLAQLRDALGRLQEEAAGLAEAISDYKRLSSRPHGDVQRTAEARDIAREIHGLQLRVDAQQQERFREQADVEEQRAAIAERIAAAQQRTSRARHRSEWAHSVTRAARPRVFLKPAYFPIREFGIQGELIEREGARIYEDMTFAYGADGDYRVTFRIETPATPVRLDLQFRIGLPDGSRHTVTLQPIVIRPTSGQRGTKTHAIVQEGTSEVLRRHYGQMPDAQIERLGSARFGFGFDSNRDQ